MEENEVKELVEIFKGYRDLLTPIEQNLRDFSTCFDGIKQDIQNLNQSFDGNINSKLDKIYKDLSAQAEKSKGLLNQLDKFSTTTQNYVDNINKLTNTMQSINTKLEEVNSIQKTADTQIERLNTIIDEKKKNYDIKQLQKSLDSYNVGVQKVNDYINKDIAENLKNNNEKVVSLQSTTESIFENMMQEKQSIEKLINTYTETNNLLKSIIETGAVNTEYVYSLLDDWAEKRNVKTKKK